MKRAVRTILGALMILCGIWAADRILSYLVVDDVGDEVRYAMHELYEQNDIETLFLGSSHVFFGYDPRILDEIMGENTYLAATPAQKADGSYYLLKEVLKNNPVRKVYLDVFCKMYKVVPAQRTSEHMMYIYCITDYMKNGWNRTEFLLNASGSDYYIESFLPSARYGNYLLDRRRLEGIVKRKRTSGYTNYEDAPSDFYKGAMVSPGTPGAPKMIVDADGLEVPEEVISSYSLKYLDKIVALCKEEGIELVLVSAPFTNLYVQAIENYDTFYHYMRNYAEANEIEYYDFNLCRTEILKMEYDDFMDCHHLSGKGAEKYTRTFAELMTSYGKAERQALFYDSVQEKIDDMPPQIMGIALHPLEGEENKYAIKTVANYDVDVEYRICILDEQENETELIQDFSDENILETSPEEPMTFRITVRLKESGEICEEASIYI